MYQRTILCAPDVHAFIKATRCQVLAVWAKCHRIHGLRVLGERMDASATLNIPQTNGRIERCTRQYQVHVWILCARTSWRPLDRVDLFRMCLEIVHAGVMLHGPDFQCHIVRARGQQLTLWIPFDGIHLICMALE